MPVEWVILDVSFSHTKQAGEPGWLSRYSYQLWAGRSRVRILAGARDFIFSKTVQTDSGDHSASQSVGGGVTSREHSGQEVMLTTHPHVVPRIRITAGITLLPLHAFVE